LELKGKKCIVVGGGKSGISAARFLLSKGASVTINDRASLEGLKELEGLGVLLEGGSHSSSFFEGKDVVVVSPGVPTDIEPLSTILAEAEKSGAEIISEIELASRFISAPIIAIAGTNGKSTTTAFIGELLGNSGKEVFVGGNIGIPLTEYLLEGGSADYIVLEVSSFQLERISTFKPYISILLNITADHLDRYKSMDEYVAAKKQLFMNQDGNDYAIANVTDEIISAFVPQIKAHLIPLGGTNESGEGIYLSGDAIVVKAENIKSEVSLSQIRCSAISHVENVMAALGVAAICSVSEKVFTETLKSFKGLSHRMELVARAGGISFYDDSKATNVGAVNKTLEGIDGKVVLIAGGKDKGGSYEPLKTVVKDKVRVLILIGEAANAIEAAIGSEVETVRASSMDDAVMKALDKALDGDSVVLSPACSSFDMFSDFAERGRVFKASVFSRVADEKMTLAHEEEVPLAG